MNALIIAARSIHIATAILLFGQFVFLVVVAGGARRQARKCDAAGARTPWPHFLAVAWSCVLASIASGVAWLGIEAVVMSGTPVAETVLADSVALVLGNTAFGRLWTVRFVMVIVLSALLLASARSTIQSSGNRIAIGMLVMAGAYLATLAWAGHAGAGEGAAGDIQLVADVVHLLSAGAWLGALPWLVLILGDAPSPQTAGKIAWRFSALGAGAVAALTLSGLVNAWFRVGDVPALVGTDYGRLLLAKIALFAVMVAIAYVNRSYLLPRLAAGGHGALHSLRRNAVIETAAGAVLIAIVGILGSRIPAVHQPPIWPFDYTLDWQALEQVVEQSAWVGSVLGAAAMAVLAAAGVVLAGLRARRPRLWLAGLAGTAVAGATWVWALAVPANPTTYFTPPVGYSTDSIARGAILYHENCSACHGRDSLSDGGAAPLSNLASRVGHPKVHPPGDLFWWIAHGIPGTSMPGLAPPLSDSDIWRLIHFLRAETESRWARALTVSIEPRLSIAAPDFTFEVPGQLQESLRHPAGAQPDQQVVLVVLYTLPQSTQRLRALAAKKTAFAQAGVRVIAVPLRASSTSVDAEVPHDGNSMFVLARPDVATVYAMFARRNDDSSSETPAHVEFLIDRGGYLRARWIGVPDAGTRRTADILAQADLLKREPPGGPAPKGHGH